MTQLIQTWAGAVPINAMRKIDEKTSRQIALLPTADILAYVEAHPWCTAPAVAAHFGRNGGSVTGVLSKFCRRGVLERRGKLRFFEYRTAK